MGAVADARVRGRWRDTACRALGLACLLAALPGTPARASSDEQCLEKADVCLSVEETGPYVSFSVRNGTPAPYSVRIALSELENLRSLVPTPFRGVVRPGRDQVVGTLERVDESAPSHFRFRWGAALGSLLARHDDRWHYRMPFGGTSHRFVSQGAGGRFSHTGANRYSWDFAMPWGTPILAARAGTVVAVVDGNIASGLRKVMFDKANKVDVLHDDGTLATYAHLRHGAVVKVGQRVATGDLIGLSGDTGYSGGPHLHFMVWRRLPDLGATTVPIRFHDGTAQGFLPGRGVAYAPACSTAGMGCAEGERPPRDTAVPAARAPGRASAGKAVRRSDGSCACPNGAVITVDLPCSLVCGN